jgi:hypothetical protein
MPLIKLTPNGYSKVKDIDEAPVETVEMRPAPHSARANADWAIHKFQSMLFDLTYEQAKDAYARLLVGRGFDHVRTKGDSHDSGR